MEKANANKNGNQACFISPFSQIVCEHTLQTRLCKDMTNLQKT
jgi:hypothetical protein